MQNIYFVHSEELSQRSSIFPTKQHNIQLANKTALHFLFPNINKSSLVRQKVLKFKHGERKKNEPFSNKNVFNLWKKRDNNKNGNISTKKRNLNTKFAILFFTAFILFNIIFKRFKMFYCMCAAFSMAIYVTCRVFHFFVQ